jgi:peptidylprolyl isomerase
VSKQPVKESARDRSGVGLPPKSERRALGKAAAVQRARAKRRKQLLNRVGTVAAILVTVLAVVGGIAALAGAFDSDAPPPAASGANPSASLNPALAEKPTVTPGGAQTPTALNVTTLIDGTGPAVQSGQTVQVNYVGTFFADGKEFDSSFGKEPFSFTVGAGGVIKGWDQGIVGVKVGSRVQLDIPADLAYGASPDAGRPGGALRFVVDVLAATGP